MNFLKAAVGAALACLMCAGMTLSAMAESISAERSGVDNQIVEMLGVDPENDPEYPKYRQKMLEESFKSKSPAGKMQTMYRGFDYIYGSYLSHDSRFNGLDRYIGIDVSQWQYSIDWNAVKASGIDFAIIRLGFRGYGSGGTL